MDELTIDDEHFFRIHGAIESHGFFTMAVMGTPTWPSWAYTIGFLEVGHPELVVVGLSKESAHGFISEAYRETAQGRPFEVGRRHRRTWTSDSGVQLDMAMIDVPDLQWEEPSDLTLFMRGYYDAKGGYPCEPRVCQLVWPDFEGQLPWDPGFDESLRTYQPLLDETPWEHERSTECTCGPGCDMWGQARDAHPDTSPERRAD
jgi:hypothetical protein